MSEEEAPVQPEAQTSKTKKKTNAPKTAAKVKDVPAPTAFAATDTAIWDGRPSLGAIWVAHPDAPQAERVQIVNKATGKKVAGALFKRKTRAAGPPIQMSSEAALALGVGPGQTTELQITAIRPEDDIPIQMAKAPAKADIWGGTEVAAEPELAPETELLLAAADAPVEGADIGLIGAVPMGVFPDYDAAVLVQARLSQAGVRSEIRETYLDEVIFYKVFAEQADTTVMVAEAKPDVGEPAFEMAQIERFVLPDQQTTVHTKPAQAAPVQLRLSDAVIVALLDLPNVNAPAPENTAPALPKALSLADNGPQAATIAPLSVASVSEGQAMKPFLTFDAAVQYAGISLATPSLSELGGIAIPTRAQLDAPEVANTTELARAEIAFQTAPKALAKGAPTELVASVTRPSAPQNDARPHVKAAFEADEISRPVAPSELAKALTGQDAPARVLERSAVTVLAALDPIGGLSDAIDASFAPQTTTKPTAQTTPGALKSAQAPTSLPKRPLERTQVNLMAHITNSVAPEALVRAVEPELMLPARARQLAGVEIVMLSDGLSETLPNIGATIAPENPLAGTRILARATPRPKHRQTVDKKQPKVTVIASILDLDTDSIRDATNIKMSAKPRGAGIAEIPNFGFGAAQSGRDDANWFGLNLLGSNRTR